MVQLLNVLIIGVQLAIIDVEVAVFEDLEQCEDVALVYEIEYNNEQLDFIWECREIN